MLIGNAANALHPVAGQGFNLGLRDAEALARVVGEAARRDGDAGSPSALARYALLRREDHRRARWLTDSLIRLFTIRASGVPLLRGLGLSLFDAVPALKGLLAGPTTGISAFSDRAQALDAWLAHRLLGDPLPPWGRSARPRPLPDPDPGSGARVTGR